MSYSRIAVVAVVCTLLGACGSSDEPEPQPTAPVPAATEPPPDPNSNPGSHPVTGFFDSIGDDGVAHGWAIDTAKADDFVDIRLYVDGPRETGKSLGYANAFRARPDVNQALSVAGDHGFEFLLPDTTRDGALHELYAYVVGPTSESLLDGSPKAFTLKRPFPRRSGKVHLDGHTLVDDTGSFSALGSTLFAASRWYKFDRPR